jgi:lipopolysaccharide export system protein LptA
LVNKDKGVMNRLTIWGLTSWLVIALASTGAKAQIAASSDAPVDVTADRLEAMNQTCSAIWSGSAEAVQDQSRLRANTITLYNQVIGGRAGNCGVLARMEAVGEVFYVTPQQTVRSDLATYTSSSDTLVMSGQVIVAQGDNVLRGDRLTIIVKTGQATMETGTKGRGKPGRVRGVFYPNKASPASAVQAPPPRANPAPKP